MQKAFMIAAGVAGSLVLLVGCGPSQEEMDRQSRLDSLEQERPQLEARLADFESEVAAIRESEQSLKAQLAELEALAGDLTTERDGYAGKASGLAQNVAALEASLEQQAADTEAVRKELQFNIDRLERVKVRRNEFQRQSKESAAALTAANGEVEFLNGRLERVKQHRDEFQAETKSMAATADASAKQIEFLNGRLERVKVRRNEFQREAKSRQSELDHWRSLEGELEQVAAAIESLKGATPAQ